MFYSDLSFAVDGDSITAGDQWTRYAARLLGAHPFQNEAVGSATWHQRRFSLDGLDISSQAYDSPDFIGISDGWQPTCDVVELQRRANNCAVVHVQRYLKKYRMGHVARPDVFIFLFGTNDGIENIGNATDVLGKSELSDCDLFTTAGAACRCIRTISESFPGCRIFTILPIQTGSHVHNIENARKAAVIKAVSEALGAQVIDPTDCGIREEDEHESSAGKYLIDGLHPNERGRELMGDFIAERLKELL